MYIKVSVSATVEGFYRVFGFMKRLQAIAWSLKSLQS